MKRFFTVTIIILLSNFAFAAKPAFLSAKTVSTTLIQVTFDQTLSSIANASGSDFTITGVTITGAAINGGNAAIVDLTVTAISPSFSCASCLNVAANAVTSAGGNNNAVNNQAVIDGIPPSFSSVTAIPNSGIVGIGGTVEIDFTSTETNLVAGTTLTVNGIDVSATFTNLTGGNYKVTYTVGSGNTDRTVNTLPLSIAVKDAATAPNTTTITTATGGIAAIDANAPTASAPTNTAQRLNSGSVSTSTVQSSEAGNIYLVLTGTTATTQAQINTAVTAKNAFLAQGSATAATPYTVTVPAASSINEGLYDIVAVDNAGNVSAVVGGWLTIDNTAPTASAPTSTAQVLKSTATSTSTVQSNEAGNIYLVLTGTVVTTQAQITAAITAKNAFLGKSAATANTAYTVTIPAATAINDGVYDIVAVDAAGNVSSAVAGWLTIDNTAPTASAPTNTAQSLQSTVTSTSTVQSTEAGNIYLVKNGTSVTTQSQINAAITAKNAFLGKSSAAANTAYTVTVPTSGSINDGVYNIVAVDAAGNVSSPTAGWLTVDNTAPSASAPTNTAQSLNSGSTSTSTVQSNEDGNIYLVLNGTSVTTQAQIDAAVTAKNAFLGKGSATANTPYTVTIPAASSINEGVYNIVAVDKAGNVSSSVGGWLTIDNTAPTASAPTNTAQTLQSGATSTSNIRSNEAGTIYLVLTGTTATTPAQIAAAVTAKNAFAGKSGANANTNYTVTVPASSLVNEGLYDIVAVDNAGNVSTVVGGWLTVDNTAPTASAPTNTAQSLQSTITSTSTVQSTEAGNIYLVKNGTSVTTQAQINSAVTAKNAFLGKSAAAANTAYTVTVPASGSINDGVYNIVAVDVAGNVSAAATGWLTVDNTAPAAPSTPVMLAADDSGISSTDGVTKVNANIRYSGTSEANATINLYRGGSTLIGTGTADGTGNWTVTTITSGTLTDGNYSITAKATDAAGNISSASSSLAITIDTAAPAAFTVGTNTTNTGGAIVNTYYNASNTGGITVNVPVANDGSLTGGTLQILVDNQLAGGYITLGSTVAPVKNTTQGVSINHTTLTTNGKYANGNTLSFKATLTDLAGNSTTTASASSTTLIIDLTPPTISGSVNFTPAGSAKAHVLINFSENMMFSSGSVLTTLFVNNTGWYANEPVGAECVMPSTVSSNTKFTSATQIELEECSKNDWDASVNFTYTNSAGTSTSTRLMRDVAGNEMNTVTVGVSAPPPTLGSDMVLFLNGTSPETIVFSIDQALNIANNGQVSGFSVNGIAVPLTNAIYTSSGTKITLTSPANGSWTSSATVTYAPGNVQGTTGAPMAAISSAEPILLNPSIASNNANTQYAKASNSVTLSFSSTKALSATPTVTIGGVAATVSGTGPYTATVAGSSLTTEGVLAWSIVATEGSRITTVSSAGAIGSTTPPETAGNDIATLDRSYVIFDKTAPSVTPINIISNNSTNTSFAKANDKIILSFTVSEPVASLPTVTIEGTSVTAVAGAGNTYTASIIATTPIFTDGNVPFTIVLTDVAGNPTATSPITTTTDASSVTFDNTPPTLQKIRVDPALLKSWSSSVNGTTSSTVTYTARFSELVSGIDLTFKDFNGTVTPKSNPSGPPYTYPYPYNTAYFQSFAPVNVNPSGIASKSTSSPDSVWILTGSYTGGTGKMLVDFNPGSNVATTATIFPATGQIQCTNNIIINNYLGTANFTGEIQINDNIYNTGNQYIGTVQNITSTQLTLYQPTSTTIGSYTGPYNYARAAFKFGGPGTISSNSLSTTVTGTGTTFLTDISPGDVLLDNIQRYIGIVQSVTNNLSLQLTTNAAQNHSGPFYISHPIPQPSSYYQSQIKDRAGNLISNTPVAGTYYTFEIPEPSNAVSSVNVTAINSTSATLQWANPGGIQEPNYYLVIAVPEATSFGTIQDGQYRASTVTTAPPAGTVISNVKKTASGSGALQTYTLNFLNSATNYDFAVYPYSLSPLDSIANNSTITIDYNTTAPSSSFVSAASDLVHSFTYKNTGIDYVSFGKNAAAITSISDGAQVEQFILRDGGSTFNDADQKPTILNSITLSFSGSTNVNDIQSVFIADKTGSIIAKQDLTPAMNGVVTFSSATSLLTAPDNDGTGTTLGVYVTFNQTATVVLDHDVINIQLVSASVKGTGSSFFKANGNSIAATLFVKSPTVFSNNSLDVIATKLVFAEPTALNASATLNTPYTSIKVLAEDINSNLDIDYNSTNSKVVTAFTNSGNPVINMSIDPTTKSFKAGVLDFADATNGLTNFQFTSGVDGETFTLTMKSTYTTKTNPTDLTGTSGTITLKVAADSYVYFDPNFSAQTFNKFLTQNAPSMPVSNANSAANIAKMAKLFLSDGGATNASNPLLSPNGVYKPGDFDGAGTTISDITFSVTGAGTTDIVWLALYDSAGNILGSQKSVTAGSVTFTGINLKANKNDTAAFTIRGTFKSLVNSDQDDITFKVTGVTWSAGSQIYKDNVSPYVGGVSGGSASKKNIIDVIATSLDFKNDQPSTAVAAGYAPSPVGLDPLLPLTTAGKVTARDVAGNIDKNFVSGTITLTDGNGKGITPPSTAGWGFGSTGTPGVLDLKGVIYNSTGNGHVRVQTSNPLAPSPIPTALDSDSPTGVSQACLNPQVIHTSVVYDATTTPLDYTPDANTGGAKLKGGRLAQKIFGVTFKASGPTSSQPLLNKFDIGFKTGKNTPPNTGGNDWYYDAGNLVTVFPLNGFKVYYNGVDIATKGGKVIPFASTTPGKYNSIRIDLTNFINSHSLSTAASPAYANIVVAVDVSSTTSGATQTLVPYLVDGGYSNPSTDSLTTVSQGTSASIASAVGNTYSVPLPGEIDGIEYNFASANPPKLLADIKVYPNTTTSPFTPQSNVDPTYLAGTAVAKKQVFLTFDTKVGVLDNPNATPTGAIYERATNTKVAELYFDISAGSGQLQASVNTVSQTISNVYDKLVFNVCDVGKPGVPLSTRLKYDEVYYINIVAGSYGQSGGQGIADQQLNFYGGLNNNYELYFKTWSSRPPLVSNVVSGFNSTSFGSFSATFDQFGSAYYIVVPNTPSPTATDSTQIKTSLMAGSVNTISSNMVKITTVGVPQTIEFPVTAFAANTDYDVYIYTDNEANPTRGLNKSPVTMSFSGSLGSSQLTTASPLVLAINSPVTLSGSSLPQPLVAATTYYIQSISGSSLALSSTPGGGAITMTTVGSGSITALVPYYYFPKLIAKTNIYNPASPPTALAEPLTPNSSNLVYEICPDSYTSLTQPMVISENSTTGTKGYLSHDAAGNLLTNQPQIVNILLPAGFEFDRNVTPIIILGPVYNDFSPLDTAKAPSVYYSTSYASSSILQIQFKNARASNYDQISISGLKVIGRKSTIDGSLPPQGEIKWFYGNDALTAHNKVPLTLATINVSAPKSVPDFTNYYWQYSNSISPYHTDYPSYPSANKNAQAYMIGDPTIKTIGRVNAVPDNFASQVRLIPVASTFTIGADFYASTFSGSGVTGDQLTLAGVSKNAPFNITMNHTDINGCVYSQVEQYIVYDHTAPIADSLGLTSSINPATQKSFASGTVQDIVNSNFNTSAGSATPFTPTSIKKAHKAGYTLLELQADLPLDEVAANNSIPSAANQLMSGAKWRALIQSQTTSTASGFIANTFKDQTTGAITDPPTATSVLYAASWDYSKILNADATGSASATDVVNHTLSSAKNSGPFSNVYDYFKQQSSASGNNYWTGGTLGKIEFTGLYQNTADASIFVPFKQQVELFLPSVPLIEVQSSNVTYDKKDTVNTTAVTSFNHKQYPQKTLPGTATFCEFGGQLTLVAFPQASGGTSVGTFAVYDYSSYFTSGATRTGTIASDPQSPQSILGSGTFFTAELLVGSILYDAAGNKIGIVQLITDNTHLTLTTRAVISSQSYKSVDPLIAPAKNSPFVDNGNGTMTLDPTNSKIKNLYNDVIVTYTFQENNSPAIGTGYLVIRVTPNPVAKFAVSSMGGNPGAAVFNAFCTNAIVNFDAGINKLPQPSLGKSVNSIAHYTWDFGDQSSSAGNLNSDTTITAKHFYSKSQTYTASLNLVSNWQCHSLAVNSSSTTLFGTITSSTGSPNVTGTGTLFGSQLFPGLIIKDATGATIGTIQNVTDNANLVLTTNAAINLTSAAGAYAYYNKTITGSINSTIGSTTVTGTGTLFTKELSPNWNISDASGNFIGAIQSITSDTQLSLKANAAIAVAGMSGAFTDQLIYSGSAGITPIVGPTLGNIIVGDIPIVDFSVIGNCTTDLIKFKDKSSTPVGSNSTVTKFDWDFADPAKPGIDTTGYNLLFNPLPSSPIKKPVGAKDGRNLASGGKLINHKYHTAGFYNVNLTTTTDLGCQNSDTLAVAQVPWKRLGNNVAYEELFNNDGGWLALNLTGNAPVPGIINSSSGPIQTTSWKYDNIIGKWKTIGTVDPLGYPNYNKNEKSALYSACLDLSTIPRPVISFDNKIDISDGEGLVMQYSYDSLNILDAKKEWDVLGTTPTAGDPGLDWYNGFGLASNPGTGATYLNSNNPSGYGWHYTIGQNSNGFVHPKHSLDKQLGNSKVILRFALSTLNAGKTGITLDSVRVGSRTRTVLFENFTTSNARADAALNATIKADADTIATFVKKNINNTQLVNINYHVGFLGNDPFNLINPADPSARVLYYGVKKVPYAFLDGTHYSSGTSKYAAPLNDADLFLNWGKGAYDLQTLKLAKADFGLNTIQGTINASTSSNMISGVSTLFTTELAVGGILRDAMGTVIGTISTITNATSLTLASNALINVSGGIATTDSRAGVTPTTVKTKLYDGSIHVDVTVTPAVDMPSTTVLHVMVLEDTIYSSNVTPSSDLTTGEDHFEYVLRKMIPDGVGTKFPANTFRGPTFAGPTPTYYPVHLGPNGAVNDTTRFKWVMAKNFDNKKFTVVVFLQDEVSKEVYQAELFRNIPYPSSTITGIEPTAENLKVYPNPADQELTITLPSPARENLSIRMANQLGEFTELGSFAEGEQTKTIKTGSLSAGVYILQMGSSSNAIRTKVVVLH